ncbi:WD40/YVTN/BNR-like repeat-containing protein [Paenibacillus sp. GCM10027628]|uniref:WD40/YVTN/BNR-like repeat-containing protein n=1 Tax=Paenibacillus sp. GCM10027628 TaxID=3273413 RepID=UPI0036455B0D
MATLDKKLLFLFLFLFFLLCAGCMHHERSSSVPRETALSKPKFASAISITSGAAITVDEQSGVSGNGEQGLGLFPALKTKNSVEFVDELHGFGVESLLEDLSVLETDNGGKSWRKVSSLAPSTGMHAISFLDDQTGWLLTGESLNRKSELRLTSDGGLTWEVIARSIPGFSGLTGNLFFRFFDRQNGLIALQTTSDMVLLQTLDGGLTWSVSSRIPLPGAAAGVLTFISPNEGWFVASPNKGGATAVLYRMSDGERWQEVGKLPDKLAPQAVSFSSSLNGWLLLQNKEISPESEWVLLRTSDGGNSWTLHTFPRTLHPMDTSLQMNFISSVNGWIQSANGLWQTTNGGMKWTLFMS